MTPQEQGELSSVLGANLARALSMSIVTLPADGAIAIDKDATYLLTKGSAAAMTLADPGADNIGRRIGIVAGSDFAHVVTTTAALANGTAVKSVWTSAAFTGSAVTLRAISATLWAVEANQLGVFT